MKKENGLLNLLLGLIVIMLLLAVSLFGYMLYNEIMNGGVIVIGEEAGFPIGDSYSNTKIDTEETIITQLDIDDESEESIEYINNYLYNQLSDYAKIIYTELYNNKESLKTGTFTIEFDDTFSDLLEQENGNILLQQEYQSAIEALSYDNPDIFYLDVTKMYINIEQIKRLFSTKYNVYINNAKDESYLSESFSSIGEVYEAQLQIKEVRDEILENIEGKTTVEKIRYIHNYLIDNITYNQTDENDDIYTIYGALVLKSCVCEGYAKAFQYLLNEAGIENVIVSGTATNNNGETENHAWNYVKLGTSWYAVDVTWDDPIIIGGGTLTTQLRYKYFLKGSDSMNENHFPSQTFTENGKAFELPELSVNDYNI